MSRLVTSLSTDQKQHQLCLFGYLTINREIELSGLAREVREFQVDCLWRIYEPLISAEVAYERGLSPEVWFTGGSMSKEPNPVPPGIGPKPVPPPAPPARRGARGNGAVVELPFSTFEALCEKAAGETDGQLAAIGVQIKEQHVSMLRFLGRLKDKLPETTAWDLYAAAALPSAIEAMRGVGASNDKLAAAAELVAEVADALLAERTKREQAAVEARKKAETKE